MRRTATLTALLVGAALLALTGAASAAGETCRGEAATIVGSGPTVQGTDGRDVIVSGASTVVRALGGDDLVCVAGVVDSFSVEVEAGAGNDVVDTTATAVERVRADLGSGADALHGGPTMDDVHTSEYVPEIGQRIPDTERDVVDTGAGADRVASFADGTANPDVITTGPGSDYLYVEGPLAAEGRLDGGSDGAVLANPVDAGNLVVDASTGTSTLDGRAWLRWSGMGGLDLIVGRVDLTYTGSPTADRLYLVATGESPSVAADMREGDDLLVLSGHRGFGATSVDGGGGRDGVEVNGVIEVEADLGAGTLQWGTVTSSLVGVEDLSAYGNHVRVAGDDGRNVLRVGGCTARATGGKGADTLERRGAEIDGPSVHCDELSGVSFSGGAGNDRLDGSRGPDVLRGGAGKDRLIGRQDRDSLLGGPARDSATGGPDRDRCKAEVERSCER